MSSENQIVINNKYRYVAAGSTRDYFYVLNMVKPECALFGSIETWHAQLDHSLPKEVLQMSSSSVA